MKGISINRSALRDGCKMVSAVVKGKNMVPILDNMLVSLDAGKGLCLRATDTTIDIKVSVAIESINGAWEPCLLNTRMFADVVDKFDGDEIFLEQKANDVSMKSGGCKGRLVFLPPDEYPAEPDMGNADHGAEIRVDKISSAVDQVKHATVKDDAMRPVLEGICLVPLAGGAYIFAIDGFRVERRILDIPGVIAEPILLNADKLSMIISLLASVDADCVRMIYTKSWCSFEASDRLTVRLRRYAEQPINVEALIKPLGEQETLFRLKRKELLAAAQRAVLFASTTPKSSETIKLRIEEGAVVIHAASAEGEISSTVEASFSRRGKLTQIAVNSRYLIECLKKGWSGVDEIDIGMSTDISPIFVSGVGSDAMDMSLVLPIRIYEEP